MIARKPDRTPKPKAEKADVSGMPKPRQETRKAAMTP